jgi:septal ring factor EnvC (AmiA/AmiB activator)
MKKVKKDLQELSKSLKSLEKKTEKLMKGVHKLEKAQAGGKRKAKAKTKTTTKARTTAKPQAKKKAAVKKTSRLTATDQAVKIIKRSKKGLDVPTLKKKTGFEDKKIRNILNRASKQGKIKRSGRGIYVAA